MNKRLVGGEKEQKIRAYMEQKGYEILEMNYRCRQGEIDIIARDEEYLVFVEVKYRSDAANGFPEDAVDRRKQNRICQAARYYMYINNMNEYTPVRFDVAGILGDEIKYTENAFMWLG